MEFFREDVTYDNIKSHQKPGLYSLSRRYIFGKTTGLVQIESHSHLRVNVNYTKTYTGTIKGELEY